MTVCQDSKVSSCLKDLPQRLQTPSLKVRKNIFNDLTDLVTTTDLAENIIKGVCKVLSVTILRYQDAVSRTLVLDFVKILFSKYPSVVVKTIHATVLESLGGWRNTAPTKSLAKPSLAALAWVCAVVDENSLKDEGMKIIDTQSLLCGVIFAAGGRTVTKKARSVLESCWAKDGVLNLYSEVLIKSNPSLNLAILGSQLLDYLAAKQLGDAVKVKKFLMEIVIKTLVMSKTKLSKTSMNSLVPFLKQVTIEEFKGEILPVMNKSLLRSPEIALSVVSVILKHISIDLSSFALELGKAFCTNLKSKDDTVREDASEAMASLSKHCSEQAAIEKLLDLLFSSLEGKDGKISLNTVKVSLLTSAGGLTDSGLPSASLSTLAVLVTKRFTKFLKEESHEATVITALEQFSLWTRKYANSLPEEFITCVTNGLTDKNSSSPIKCGYFMCLTSSLNSWTRISAVPLAKTLMKVVEAGKQQNAQLPLVTEAVMAAACLLTIGQGEDTSVELGPLLDIATDTDKCAFYQDKFLSSASPPCLSSLSSLVTSLLTYYPDKMSNVTPLYRCAALSLVSSNSEVRAGTVKDLCGLGKTLGGAGVVASVLRQLVEIMAFKTITVDGTETGGGGELAASDSLKVASVLAAVNGLVSGVSWSSEDSVKLSLSLLPVLCHPTVVSANSKIMNKVNSRLGLKAAEVYNNNSEEIRGLVDELIKSKTSVGKEVVRTIIKHSPKLIIEHLIHKTKNMLSDPELVQVSVEDFMVFQTPEGELYDKSAVENLKSDDGAHHMKRENKAYSYKEQMEELALRKELEAKRAKAGKTKAPELSQKQKELMKQLLSKESETRARLRELDEKTAPCLDMLEAAVTTDVVSSIAPYLDQVLQVLYHVTQSPLVARRVTDIIYSLRRSVFSDEEEALAQLVAGVTLQVLRPACQTDFPWTPDQLKMSVAKTVASLHTATVPPKSSEEEEDKSCPLSAPAFYYSFVLIKKAMQTHVKQPEVLHQCFDIIAEHTELRGSDMDDNEEGVDLFHPRFLPRSQMVSVLLDLISQTEGTVQQTAVKCLIDTAVAASGDAGCARAEDEEVHSFIAALYSDTDAVRDAALRGLLAIVQIIFQLSSKLPKLVKRVWVLRCDTSPENRQLAEQLWETAELTVTPGLCLEVLEDVAHPVEVVRMAAAEALSALLADNTDQVGPVLTQLLETYQDKLEMSPPVMDHLGRIVEESYDNWEPRSGIALALAKIQTYYDDFMVTQAVTFFVPQGLGDRNEVVRKDMLAAAVATIDNHGKNTVADLLPVFEDFLDNAPSDSSYDIVRQSVVILMGGLARHLEKEDPKVRPIIGKLIAALVTPSQQVQEAVANCLPPLVPAIKDEAPKLTGELMETLLNTENFGERKGAAYGLAGLVKGLGILSLKQLDIMTKLTEALQDKKNYRHREGSLLALSQLCAMLGRLFEPYIVHVLPHLLLCFGDSNQYVREATDDCAKAVMSKLSAHGVKLVLPSLLAALEEDQWRTKTGSVELLGAMAFCAPKQLSSCLPSIVPKIIEVLGDSHHRVQAAGVQALKVIGSVIRNPEIQAIVPVLLSALQDPAKKTGTCLQRLLDTKFVHFIDAPSLALIMPAVQRAFQDRSTETRKMAAQIIGNMYSLTDQKDLAPYLPGIIPGLKASLLDPVPEVRGVSARALGAMVKGMGEQSFEELLPWLMSTLTSESSSVDRSGAAQGLAEVVGGLGVDKMHKLMPEIVSTAERMDIAPHVKDGYIMMFIYMPAVFQDQFKDYIGQVVKPILRALADENEFVRDTALKAGQRIVNMYADTAITLLLPQLEGGLFDDNWRIRYSSIQLLGDLLYKISGVSGKMTTASASDDDNFGTEQGQKIITNMLGTDRRNRVLAGLYMGRSDVALMVRQSALHVWKVIVTNTPKTLREILPTLFNLLLGCLASANYDKRQVAARTLGDLVRKLGERVLPEIIPILEKGLDSDDRDKRQGVCVGLSEIMNSTSRDMVLTFVDSLVPTVRKALCDNDSSVRQAAARTFDSLHTVVGSRALDDILPAMLDQLSDPDMHENALDGLRQIMAIKSRAVLPYLIPQLTATPVNTKALSILASVAGESLNKHLAKILPALLTCLAESHGTPDETAELGYARAVVLSVQDETGVSYVMDILLDNCKSRDSVTRRGAVTLLAAFCDQTKVDMSEYVPQLLRSLILLFTDTDKGVLAEAHSALTAVTKSLDPGQQMSTVPDIRQAVRFARADLKEEDALLPGFCLPKGIAPLLPIFRESILNGAPELKEAAANGLGEIIKLTSVDALKPSVVHITGPLIRILGDRFSHNVKTAVLDTLAILLSKASAMLKPFLPQLQTTFLKALNDPHRTVRLKAGFALSHLITIHTRPDPLYNELHGGMKNSEDSAVRDTYIQAMRGCVSKAGDKLSPTIRRTLTASLLQMIVSSEDVTRGCAAGCLASLLPVLPEEELNPVLAETVLADDPGLDWTLRHGRSACLAVALAQSPATVTPHEDKLVKTILSQLQGDHVSIVANGVRSAGYLILDFVSKSSLPPQEIVTPFLRSINHSSNDVKILVSQMISLMTKSRTSLLPTDLLRPIVPTLIAGTMEKNSMVRSCSETALVDVLQLRKGPQGQSEVLVLLDTGAKESLVEITSKSLTKLATQPEDKSNVLDDTMLM